MTIIDLHTDLVEQLQQMAHDRQQSVDQVVADLLATANPSAGAKGQAHFRSLANFMPKILSFSSHAIITINHERTILFYNQGAEQVFGYSASAVIGHLIDTLVPDKYLADFVEYITDFAESDDTARWMNDGTEIYGQREDGTIFPVEASISKFEQDDKLVFTIILRDITQQKLMERALLKSEQRYAAAEEIGQFGHWERDFTADRAFWSPGMFQLFGLDVDGTAPNYAEFLSYLHPHDRSMFDTKIQNALTTSGHLKAEYRIIRKDGTERYVYSTGYVKHDPVDDAERIVGTVVDITGRKHIEEISLHYKAAVEASNDLIVAVDANFRYLIANKVYLHYHNRTREDVIGSTLAEILGEVYFEQNLLSLLTNCLAGEVQNFEYKHVFPRLGERILLVSFSPMRDASAEIIGVVIVLKDITERKRAELGIRENEQKLQAIFEVLPVGVALLDSHGHVAQANPALEQIAQLTSADFLAGTYYNRNYIRSDGSTMAAAEFPSRQAIDENQAIHDVEIGIVKEDGDTIWTSVSVAPLSLPGLSAVVITTDITERKQANAQKLALRMEQERSNILAEFITNSAHEFRTPLTLIRSNTYLLSRSTEDPKQVDMLEKIDKQVDVILSLVDQLTRMTNLESALEYPMETCNLNRLLRQNYHVLTYDNNLDVSVHLELDDALPQIEGNSRDLHMVIAELIENSLRHTPAGGAIYLESAHELGHAIIRVRDTGIGMTPEVQARIFERFYRLDSAHSTRGFGLGLPMARKIIELHHGTIDVTSIPEKGTTVTVTLPVTQP